MIYLTGDVHTEIPGYWEQKIAGNEIDAAKKYLEILQKYKICSTLFINGECLDKEPQKVKELLAYDVELGGHTYDNFGGMGIIKSYFYRKIYGCIYGPIGFQKKDITRTRRIFERFGLKMTSWRTHAFGSNEDTFRMLAKNNVKYVSDLLGMQMPFEKGGIIHLPINIPVDNNTICVGPLTPENRDPFASCTKGRILPEEWFEIVKNRIKKNEKEKKDSILLIHPESMKALDNFKLFEKIAKFLSKYKNQKISEFKPQY